MKAPLVHLVRPALRPADNPPMLLFLHGVGSREDDLFSLAGAFDPRFVVVSARAPLTLRPGSYAWFPVQFTPDGPVADAVEAERSLGILAQFLRWAVEEYGTDPSRTTAVGFSQGSILASGLALVHPDAVSTAVMMSGRLLPEFVDQAAPASERQGQRWLVVHGTEDNVLPIVHGRASRKVLQDLGIAPAYREFAMGHTVTDESLELVSRWVSA